MNKPKITIGVLNRNGIKRLKKIVPSLTNQKYGNLEIIVLDNGSTDKSIDYIEKFKKIKVLKSKENLGYGKAKNKIVKECNGQYVLLIDNDIELKDKYFINKLYARYIEDKRIGFLSPVVLDFGRKEIDSIGLFYSRIQRRLKIEKIKNRGLIQVGGFPGNVVFFKKEMFVKLKGFDEIYPFNIDDYDLSARSSLEGYNCFIDTNLIAIHHGVDSRNNVDSLSWKEQYYFSGFSRMMLKNYRLHNLIIWFPISATWIIYKNLILCINYKSYKPLKSLIKSIALFIADLPSTLYERKFIQEKRKIKADRYLQIKI